jgi:uncharacterized protein DUF2628
MTVFTVHEPPPRRRETTTPPERIVFVRDGFYFWAFLLGPLWMIWRRLWLVLAIYLVVTAAVQAGLWALGVSFGVKFTVAVLIALLVGFEAATLRRWSLRRWKELGLVVAPNREMAERQFFDRLATPFSMASMELPHTPANPPPAPGPVPPTMRVPTSDADVIGLFPQPQPRA